MAPDSDRIASRTGVGPDPSKIATLFIIFIEFYANGKYHGVLFWGRSIDPVFWGAPACRSHLSGDLQPWFMTRMRLIQCGTPF